MARLIRHESTGPYRIEPQDLPRDKPLFICGCGLSRSMPRCDGSHKQCRDEQAGTLYVYDAASQTVLETRPDKAH